MSQPSWVRQDVDDTELRLFYNYVGDIWIGVCEICKEHPVAHKWGRHRYDPLELVNVEVCSGCNDYVRVSTYVARKYGDGHA